MAKAKVAKNNVIIQITLNKELVKAMDSLVAILNKDPKEGKWTRSRLITVALIQSFENPQDQTNKA